MAGYREHISVSGLCGACYGFGASTALGFTPEQGAVAGLLTWVAGMLPDLDSDSGKPIQEIFSLLAAAVPMVMIRRLLEWTSTTEGAIVLAAGIYALIRYGAAYALKKVSVHRGMFHSVPAMIIAAQITFLVFAIGDIKLRLLMAGGVGLGFLSHLILDELYSVQWTGVRLRLAKSAGSALKFVGNSFLPNVVTYALLMLLAYAILADMGLVERPHVPQSPSPLWQQAAEERPGLN